MSDDLTFHWYHEDGTRCPSYTTREAKQHGQPWRCEHGQEVEAKAAEDIIRASVTVDVWTADGRHRQMQYLNLVFDTDRGDRVAVSIDAEMRAAPGGILTRAEPTGEQRLDLHIVAGLKPPPRGDGNTTHVLRVTDRPAIGDGS